MRYSLARLKGGGVVEVIFNKDVIMQRFFDILFSGTAIIVLSPLLIP